MISDQKLEMENTKNLVRQILKEHPATRDNDNLLFAVFLSIRHDLKLPVDQIARATKYETVRRSRQEIQSPTGENQYHASARVLAARARRQEIYQKMYSQKQGA